MTEHGMTATETQRGDSMDFYETLKSGALCGNSSGGGGNVKNYMTSEIESGTLDTTGAEVDNPNRIRTSDFVVLEPGTYTIFYTSDQRVIAFRYDMEGTFIERSSSNFERAPLSFTVTESQKFRFVFSSPYGTEPLSPSDMKNLVLLKN